MGLIPKRKKGVKSLDGKSGLGQDSRRTSKDGWHSSEFRDGNLRKLMEFNGPILCVYINDSY